MNKICTIVLKILITIIVVFISNAYCFSWKECSSQGLGTFDIFGLFTSSSQFSTSTGGCALIGQIDHDKRVFFTYNIEKFQNDVAQGQGDYVKAYSLLAKCDESKLGRILQKHYQRIFSKSEDNLERMYLNMDEVIRENNQTGDLCRVGV